jgi:hypothetical protein
MFKKFLARPQRERKKKLWTADGPYEADADMVPLLRALNSVGLKTTQHCTGHGQNEAYISIDLRENVQDVAVRMIDGYPRLLIRWWFRGVAQREGE